MKRDLKKFAALTLSQVLVCLVVDTIEYCIDKDPFGITIVVSGLYGIIWLFVLAILFSAWVFGLTNEQ